MQRAFETHVNWERFLMSHRVTLQENGLRLDQFLRQRYTKRSRNLIQKAIFDGKIKVSRLKSETPFFPLGELKPSLKLKTGDIVFVENKKKEEPPVRFDYQILYEDDSILVVDKPPFLPVHPAGRFYFHSLLTHLRTKGFQVPLDADHEYYLPHRIDKDTSGLILIAKSSSICEELSRQFRQREVEKIYLAIVHGDLKLEKFAIDTPIARNPNALVKIKMAPTPENQGGLRSLTLFEKLSSNGNFTLLKCILKTGRQHQIRVHLASHGFPIVGDKLYSLEEKESVQFYEPPALKSKFSRHELRPAHLKPYERFISEDISKKLILPRHALHAHLLSFKHPVTKEKLTFKAQLAEDLQKFLDLKK